MVSAMYGSSKLQIFDKGENRYVLWLVTTQFARNLAAKLIKAFLVTFFSKKVTLLTQSNSPLNQNLKPGRNISKKVDKKLKYSQKKTTQIE